MLSGSGPKMVACGPYVARQPPVVDWQERLFFLHSHLSGMLIYTFSMYATHWWLLYVHYCKWQYVEYCTFSSCFHLLILTSLFKYKNVSQRGKSS